MEPQQTILKEVDELARAKDPFILMREKYANEMLSFCMYQVLILDKKVLLTALSSIAPSIKVSIYPCKVKIGVFNS